MIKFEPFPKNVFGYFKKLLFVLFDTDFLCCLKVNDQCCHKMITLEPFFPQNMFGTMPASCFIRWVLESWYDPNQSQKNPRTGARSPQSGCTRLLRLWWAQLMPTLKTLMSKAKPSSPSPPMATHVMERMAQWRTSLGQLSHEDACARAAVHLLSADAVLDAAAQL